MSCDNTITITLNGKPYSCEKRLSFEKLLFRLNTNADRFVVEHNREIVDKISYPATFLKEGDIVEIISFVGGGS